MVAVGNPPAMGPGAGMGSERTIVAAPAPSSAPMSGSVRSVASSPAPTAPPGHAGALQKAQGKAVPHAHPTHPGTARSRAGIETPQDRSKAPSRTSSLDSAGAASGVASGASHFRTPSRDSDFRESRFYSGQRSPSVESSASLQKVQTNLHQSRQHMQEVEQTMQAMRGALESSKELLTRSSLAHGDDVLTVSAANEKEPTSFEELARRLQSQQEALIAKLTQRWEQRFAALEQALSSGLEVATAATGSMNDRLTRFVSLAEVLEGAVERVIHSSKDIATLSRKVSQIEDDVACLAQELASDQKGRSEAVTLAEVDAACEELRRELGPGLFRFSLARKKLQSAFAKELVLLFTMAVSSCSRTEARHLGGSPPELLGALEQLPLEAAWTTWWFFVGHSMPQWRPGSVLLFCVAGTQMLDRSWQGLKTFLPTKLSAKLKVDGDSALNAAVKQQLFMWNWRATHRKVRDCRLRLRSLAFCLGVGQPTSGSPTGGCMDPPPLTSHSDIWHASALPVTDATRPVEDDEARKRTHFVPWEPAWTLRLAAVLSQLGTQGANLRLTSGLSNALLQGSGNVRQPQMCPLFWTGCGDVRVGLYTIILAFTFRCQGFANHYVFAVLVEELEEQCSAGASAMPLSELAPLLQGLAMARGGAPYGDPMGPGMLACLRTGLATSGVAALSTPQLLQLQSSVGKDGPLAELIADLPSRVQRMSLPELAAAAPVLSTENAAWARLAELTRVDLDSESFEIALAVACALKSPPLKQHCEILEQLESAAASASPSLQARLLLLALRGAGESNAEEEIDTRARSVVNRVLTDVGGRLAAADLAGIPWAHAAELLQALAQSSAQAPPGLVGGLVEVIFAGDMFDRTLGELATVFFALAELGADLENLATRCDLAAKLATAGRELEQEALIRLFWAMAIGKVQDPVAWQLCTQLCAVHLADGSSALPEPLAQLRSEAEEARRQQLQEEMQPKAAKAEGHARAALVTRPSAGWRHKEGKPLTELKVGRIVSGKVTNCYRDMVFVDISAEQDGCFRSPKGQQFRVGEMLRNLAIRAVDLDKGYVHLSAPKPPKTAKPSKGKAPAGQSSSQVWTALSTKPTSGWQHKEGQPLAELEVGRIVSGKVTNCFLNRVWVDIGAEKDGCFRTAGRRFQVGEVLTNLQIRAVDLDKGFVHISPPS
ncbi:unnamed protein product [Symbiodinium sp. CCMP2456]|nr:unnamed protein product [Symbiodinium sp. CCMP2456]